VDFVTQLLGQIVSAFQDFELLVSERNLARAIFFL
jgi:hypothetical protein